MIRPVFTFLSSFDLNKGIVILLLTLLVKMVLYPLTYKMLKSQAKMAALKPKMAHLKEKFKDDAQQMQIETMKIYREFGVNPLGGCLPMVLQMPIWIALYRFFLLLSNSDKKASFGQMICLPMTHLCNFRTTYPFMVTI